MMASQILKKIKEYQQGKRMDAKGNYESGVSNTKLTQWFGAIKADQRKDYLERLKKLGCLQETFIRGSSGRPAVEWFIVGELPPNGDFSLGKPPKYRVVRRYHYEYMADFPGNAAVDDDTMNAFANDGWRLKAIAPSGQWVWERERLEINKVPRSTDPTLDGRAAQ